MPFDSTTGQISGKKSKRSENRDYKKLLETSRKVFLPALIRLANSNPEFTPENLKKIMHDPNLTMWEKNFLSYGVKSTIKGDGEFIKFILIILYGRDFQKQNVEGDYKKEEKEHAQKTDEELTKETIEIANLLKQISYEKQNP